MRRMELQLGTTRALRSACGALAARRGSTLILVVATLALLAVLTVAYVSIGGGDRRSARTTTRAAEVDRQARHVGDYLIDIVGDDALAVYFDGFDPDGQPVLMTEAVDLPRTDPNRTFDGRPLNTTPEPQRNYYGLAFTPTGSLPPLRASDNPTQTAENLLRGLRPFGPSDPFLASPEPVFLSNQVGGFANPAYTERVDWPKISNVSPNGLFVNLHNLRGDFFAEPGIGAGQMSENLSLPGTRSDPYGPRLPEVPAHFDSLQIGAYQPVDPSFYGGLAVDDPDYPWYQWADADGDGFFDSRWTELVDVTFPGGPRLVVPNEGDVRYFVATRIIDLNGRVDVNVARGIMQAMASGAGVAGEPSNAHRLGVSPSDIDLLRLLKLEHPAATFNDFYDSATQPPSGAMDYGRYDNAGIAAALGQQGYWGLRRVLDGEQPAPGAVIPLDEQTAEDRRLEYEGLRLGGDRPLRTTDRGILEPTMLGTEDLLDLLAFNGLNNPNMLSSLERAVGGRDTSEPNLSPLRENRSLRWERDLTMPEALGLRHNSVRQHLTTLSGGLPRVPTRVLFGTAAPTALQLFTSTSSLRVASVAVDPENLDPEILHDGYRLLGLGAPSDLPTDPVGQATQRLRRNAHPLLRAYANALLPAAIEPDAWATPEWDTTFYGFDKLFALRTAAHMTANMIDAFDADTIPSAFTLLVDGNSAARAALENDPAAQDIFPWWSEPETVGGPIGIGGRLDLGDERLPDASDVNGVVAMNVYGHEMHPFITQVSLYNIFTDSPPRAGGDDEYVPPDPGGGGVPGLGTSSDEEITIDFDTVGTNSDFVGQVLAVQLSNPFTRDIQVEAGQYLIRFGTRFDGLFIPAGTVIPAGASIVVHAKTTNFEQRASDAAVSFFSVTSGQVGGWINLHLTGDAATTSVELTGAPVNNDDFLSGNPGETGALADANREVSLWHRLYRDGGESTDVMVDRIFDPAPLTDRPTLDRRPPANEFEITGTVAGPEETTAVQAQDNWGFSLATWATIARPTGAAAAPLGALPAYILEKRFLDDGQSLNEIDTDGIDFSGVFDPKRTNFISASADKLASAERSLRDVFASTGGTSGMTPQYPTDIALDANDATHRVRKVIAASDHPGGIAFDQRLFVESLRNDNRGLLEVSNNNEVRMLRPGDFLGVIALGPVQMPAVDGGALDPAIVDWFTTGELLTLALGYDNAPDQTGTLFYPGLPRDIYTNGLLDRGHLSLDLAAPFVDLDGNGTFTVGVDERRGLGIPHAMAMVSSVTTLGVPIDARTPVTGRVNINTASEAVASVLPGLTPTFNTPAEHWITDGATVLHDDRSDVAAGVRSYRDKAALRVRSGTAVSFRSSSSDGDLDPADLNGRAQVTRIGALREHAGLLSVGEMLAADLPPPPPAGGPIIGGGSYAQPHLIRRLGRDGRSLSVAGIDAVRYDASGRYDRADGTLDDGIADDFDEQLALFNGVSNTVSVRSDVYAIWFVLHGYAREDVEGLTPNDPLTPSVARRYLIVLDRSNIRRAGDRPKVLLFEELPL